MATTFDFPVSSVIIDLWVKPFPIYSPGNALKRSHGCCVKATNVESRSNEETNSELWTYFIPNIQKHREEQCGSVAFEQQSANNNANVIVLLHANSWLQVLFFLLYNIKPSIRMQCWLTFIEMCKICWKSARKHFRWSEINDFFTRPHIVVCGESLLFPY